MGCLRGCLRIVMEPLHSQGRARYREGVNIMWLNPSV